jgi:hypothetical protein
MGSTSVRETVWCTRRLKWDDVGSDVIDDDVADGWSNVKRLTVVLTVFSLHKRLMGGRDDDVADGWSNVKRLWS